MIEKVKDIERALSSRAYLSALSLALTIPDICAQVAYHRETSSKAGYIDWFDQYIYPQYRIARPDGKKANLPQFNGSACYALRCALFHDGSLDIDDSGFDHAIHQFSLCVDSKTNLSVAPVSKEEPDGRFELILDVDRLCRNIASAARAFYCKAPDKRVFNDHRIRILDFAGESGWEDQSD